MPWQKLKYKNINPYELIIYGNKTYEAGRITKYAIQFSFGYIYRYII